MAQKIGLAAVLDMTSFNRGMRSYNAGIAKMTGNTKGFKSGLGGLGGTILGVGTKLAMVAAGGLALFTAGLLAMGKGAIRSAADIQLLRVALETLVARELARGEQVEETSTKIQHLTEKERQRLKDLALDYNVLTARIQEQREKIRQLTEVWTEQGLNVNTAKARLEEMIGTQEKMGNEISKLREKEGKLVTTQEKVWVSTMDMADALELAIPKAQGLLEQLRDLSLTSPFEYRQVADAFRVMMAFGATTDVAMDLTTAILDTGAALGMSSDMLQRLQYNLAQAVIQGDLTMINLRQLRLVGLDLAEVFRDQLGMSVEEVRAALDSGKMTMEEVGKAFADYADKYFAGAAQRMSETFIGLKSNIADLFLFAGSDLLTPALEEVTGWLNDAFGVSRDLVESGYFARLGEQLGEKFAAGLDKLKQVLEALKPFWHIFKNLKAEDWGGAVLHFAGGVANLTEVILGWDRERALELGHQVKEIGDKALGAAQGISDFTTALVETSWQARLEWLAENGATLQGALDGIAESFGRIAGVTSGADMTQGMENLASMQTVISDEFLNKLLIVESAIGGVAGAVEWLGENLPEFNIQIGDSGEGFDLLASATESAGKGFQALLTPATFLMDTVQGMMDDVGTLTDLYGTDLGDIFSGLGDEVEHVAQLLGIDLVENTRILGEAWDGFSSALLDPNAWIQIVFNTLSEIQQGFEGLVMSIDAMWTLADAMTGLSDAFEGVKDGIETLVQVLPALKLPDWLTPGSPTPFELALRAISTLFKETIPEALAAFTRILFSSSRIWHTIINSVRDKVRTSMDDARQQMVKNLGKMEEAWVRMGKRVIRVIEKIIEKLDEIPTKIVTSVVVTGPAGAGAGATPPPTGGAPPPTGGAGAQAGIIVPGFPGGTPGIIIPGRPGRPGIINPGRPGIINPREIISIGEEVGKRMGDALIGALSDKRTITELGRSLSGIASYFAGLLAERTGDETSEAEKRIAEINEEIQSILDEEPAGYISRIPDLMKERIQLEKQLTQEKEKQLALEKAIADFEFLQRQMELLDLLRQYELDPGEILKGIKLGLDADIGSLVEAFAKAMQMIVAKVEEELQIGSPSKRFYDIFRNVMEGGILAVRDSAPALAQATQAAFSMPMAMAGAQTGGPTINLQMSNTINTPMDEAALMNRVERSIVQAVRYGYN